MESALEFAGYDYRFELGPGGHDLEHAGSILPDILRWLWRDYPGVKTVKKTIPVMFRYWFIRFLKQTD